MYVLIKPLPDEDYEDDNPDELYNMGNEAMGNPRNTLNNLVGPDMVERLFNFGEEPEIVEPEPEKERPFVDPNQLSLFENKNTIRNILRLHIN